MPSNAEISLNPTSALGDILSSDGTSRTRVASGTSGYILSAQSSASSGIEWLSPGSAVDYFVNISTATISSDVTSVSISNIPWSTYHVIKLFIYPAAQGSASSNDYAHVDISFHSTSAASAITTGYNSFGGYYTTSAGTNFARGNTTIFPTSQDVVSGNNSWGSNEITMFTGDSTKQMCGFIRYFGGFRSATAQVSTSITAFHVTSVPTSINRIQIASPLASGLRAGTRIDFYGIKRYGA
jgi:hypothetical protein